MKKDTSSHDFIVYDLMAKLSDISSRAMMGGWAIYSDKVTFALIIRNQLYFKAKGALAKKLESQGWTKFSYERAGGKVVSMSYWLVTDDLVDDQEKFDDMAREVIENLEVPAKNKK
jgi:DNA transformation protein